MHNYRIIVKSNSKEILEEEYDSLMEALLYVGNMLNNMKILDCFDKGNIIPSKFLDNHYQKVYLIKNKIPDCEVSIKKIAPGDINIDDLFLYIRKIKEIYERTDN